MDVIDIDPIPHSELLDITGKIDHLGDFFIRLIPLPWHQLLAVYHDEIRDVGAILQRLIKEKGHELCPQPHNVFRALALCPWMETKVVIIGQDPYFLYRDGIPSATGCCFECRKGNPIERSLETIITVLALTIEDYEIPKSGDLSSWALQGVLLLNASMTTTHSVANAHAGIWEFFPVRILEYLSKMRKNVVYMLWGKFAQDLKEHIEEKDNLILEASHPAARGAHNTFRASNHFNEANEYLEQNGRSRINWRL